MELPDGFPAKVEVPVGYGVTAKVEFRNFLVFFFFFFFFFKYL